MKGILNTWQLPILLLFFISIYSIEAQPQAIDSLLLEVNKASESKKENIWIKILETSYKTGNDEDGIRFAHQGIADFSKSRNYGGLSTMHRWLVSFYAINGKFDSAAFHIQKANIHFDELSSKQKATILRAKAFYYIRRYDYYPTPVMSDSLEIMLKASLVAFQNMDTEPHSGYVLSLSTLCQYKSTSESIQFSKRNSRIGGNSR